MTSPPSGPADGATWLFVPGDRPDRFDKAAASGADHVVLDLEDAVLSTAKKRARDAVASWLAKGRGGWVRVNGVGTPWHDEDLAALAGLPGLAGVMLPKAESLAAVAAVAASSPAVVALVETARGVQRAAAMADSGHVARLALGTIDLALDLGADESDEALLMARSAVVVASRAAGLPGPVDGVTTATSDPVAAVESAARARSIGFTGKLCVHPRQVEPVASTFAPSEDEQGWSRKVLTAAAGHPAGVFDLDGHMVDQPVLERARAILARAARRATTPLDVAGEGHR